MKLTDIADRIAYLPASEEPLSADVAVIRGDRFNWLYDAGASDEAAELIARLPGKNNIILSHFHQDHSENLSRVPYETLYCGAFAKKKFPGGLAVTQPLTIDDGLRLEIFPLPSTHSRGAVGLRVDSSIAFLGDAVGPENKHGRAVYNANTLAEMIACLEAIGVAEFALSHRREFVQPREKIIAALRSVYSRRRPSEAYIPAY